ncbi:hypothetical protein SEA_FRANKIE_97 [Mycobacterium phage Frankie]|nr:hypothetical protein SEA_FRANKIE_97 [Mycobacterium phage Frankie]
MESPRTKTCQSCGTDYPEAAQWCSCGADLPDAVEQDKAAAEAARTAGRLFAAELRVDKARRDLARAEGALAEARN